MFLRSALISLFLLASIVGLPFAHAAKPPAGGVRIMPLGDSITQADKTHASYRYWLQQNLQRWGFRADFVGSQTENHEGKNPKPDIDPNHEGHWGFRTDQVLEKIDAWAKAARPDVVLIHLGTNNLDPPDVAAADLGKIIDALRKQNPRVIVLLCQVIQKRDAPDKVTAFNAAVAKLAKQKNASGSPLMLVDQATGFDPEKLTYDGTHPNEAGEKLIADRFFSALRPFLDKQAPLMGRTVSGKLTPLNNFLRTTDYGGVSAEIDEMTAGGRLTPDELSEAARLLEDISAYAAAQRERVKYLTEKRRYADAGPILEKLAKQFRGVQVGHDALDTLAAWNKNPTIAKELPAGPTLQLARQAQADGRWTDAYKLYNDVAKNFPNTAAARESKELAEDLIARGLVKP